MDPIALSKFSAYVQEMHKDRDFGFETEYAVSYLRLICHLSKDVKKISHDPF